MNESPLFTPRTMQGERLRLRISSEDRQRTHRGRRWRAVVTDLDSGIAYLCRGASCGLPRCFCDAVVIQTFASRNDVPEALSMSLERSHRRYRASGPGLHDRKCRGEALASRERARLDDWYRKLDGEEEALLVEVRSRMAKPADAAKEAFTSGC